MTNQTASQDSDGNYRQRMLRRGPAVPGKIEKARDPRRALIRLVPYLYPYKVTLIVVLILLLISTIRDGCRQLLLESAMETDILATQEETEILKH